MTDQQIHDLIENAIHPLIYRISDPLKSDWIYSSANLPQRDSMVPFYDLKERRIIGQLHLYPELNFDDLSNYPLSFSTYAGFKYANGQPAFVGDIYKPSSEARSICIIQGLFSHSNYQSFYYSALAFMDNLKYAFVPYEKFWLPDKSKNHEHPLLPSFRYLGNVYRNPELLPSVNQIDYDHGSWAEG